MRQEDKVATLEQCKRLVEWGVVLKTEKYWIPSYVTPNIVDNYRLDNDTTGPKRLPAPDIAELGMLLPKTLGVGEQFEIRIEHDSGCWLIDYYDHYEKYLSPMPDFIAETEAQARCAALIWLIENKHIKPEDLKL